MKTCPVCALDLDDTYLFCPDDGSSLRTLAAKWRRLPAREAQIEDDDGSSVEAQVAKGVAGNPSKNDSAGTCESDDENPGAVVLYCPTCAAEYPLTFSECPVHRAKLTKHRIPKQSISESNTVAGIRDSHKAGAALNQHKLRLTSLDLQRPRIESSQYVTADRHSEFYNREHAAVGSPSGDGELSADDIRDDPQRVAVDAPDKSDAEFSFPDRPTDVANRTLERPGVRIAAIAMVIALALLALVALHTIFSQLSRRRSSPVVRVATQAEATPQLLPFIATPREAQEYKEESPIPAASARAEHPPERSVERRRNETTASSAYGHSTRKTPAISVPKPPGTTPAQLSARMSKVLNSPAPPLPRGNSGGFDARLVRVRGRKTSSGYRYDLTFNMREQVGRFAQWQRLLISTRSTSGLAHSEAIPFVHRLGATGALTFTVSVEMAGRSEPDWEGRIVCTTLGWDNNGTPLQASFGATVTP